MHTPGRETARRREGCGTDTTTYIQAIVLYTVYLGRLRHRVDTAASSSSSSCSNFGTKVAQKAITGAGANASTRIAPTRRCSRRRISTRNSIDFWERSGARFAKSIAHEKSQLSQICLYCLRGPERVQNFSSIITAKLIVCVYRFMCVCVCVYVSFFYGE